MWRKVRVCLQFLASVVFMAFCFIVALRDQIAKSLIWLPLSVGVGGTGASKKKTRMLLRACNFKVTLRSNSFRLCGLCDLISEGYSGRSIVQTFTGNG